MLTELLFLVVIVSAFCIGMAAGYLLATKHVKEMVLEAEALDYPIYNPDYPIYEDDNPDYPIYEDAQGYPREPVDDTEYVDSYYDYLDDEEARYEAWQQEYYS